MLLGVFTVLFGGRTLEETLKYLSGLGVQAVEIGCGGYPGNSHCNAAEMIDSKVKIQQFRDLIEKYNMKISALSVHGNAVHPNKEIAKSFHRDFEIAVRLAPQLGVDRVVTFSGCPGDSYASLYPNWVTCAWPDDFQEILQWQWEDVLIPYWTNSAEFARTEGIEMIALEMHPGFCVYNPSSLIKLRNAVGKVIGANFDPSHLFWQGIDPVQAIRELKGAIYHFHAKDTRINAFNTSRNGVLDTSHFGAESERSWIFRSVGYGHDLLTWKDICSELRMSGYDYVMSIEHEDSLMTSEEGLEKAVDFLKSVIMFKEKPSGMWWA